MNRAARRSLGHRGPLEPSRRSRTPISDQLRGVATRLNFGADAYGWYTTSIAREDRPAFVSGIVLNHAHARFPELRCEALLIFDRPEIRDLLTEGQDVWDVVSRDPLWLNPAIRCGRCGAHGEIREGLWLPIVEVKVDGEGDVTVLGDTRIEIGET